MKTYDENYLFWPKLKYQENLESNNISKIPKIIHQLWLGNKEPPMNLIQSWKRLNPSWKHILWTEDRLKYWNFINKKQIDDMEELNGKCDIIRYEILYNLGGFFIDCDTICLKPLDSKLFNYECMSVFENEKQRGGLVACGFMATEPKCKLIKHCMDELKISKSPAWWYLGPAYFTHIIKKYNYPIKLFPSWYFIPRHYTGEVYQGKDTIYCDHLWGSTFKTYDYINEIDSSLIDKLRTQQFDKIKKKMNLCRRSNILNYM